MFEDLDDAEVLLYMEKRFGPLTKTISGSYNMDKIDSMEQELVSMLVRYKSQLSVSRPVPRIRMWVTDNKVNFLFFDKVTNRRILLGQWLANKEMPHEN